MKEIQQLRNKVNNMETKISQFETLIDNVD